MRDETCDAAPLNDLILEHFQNPPHEWSDAHSEAAEYARYDRLRNEGTFGEATPYTGNDDIETICEMNSANLGALVIAGEIPGVTPSDDDYRLATKYGLIESGR